MAHIERHFGYLGGASSLGAVASASVLGPRPANVEWAESWDRLAGLVERDATFGSGPAELAAITPQTEGFGLSRRTVEAIRTADRLYPKWHILDQVLTHVDDATQARFNACR